MVGVHIYVPDERHVVNVKPTFLFTFLASVLTLTLDVTIVPTRAQESQTTDLFEAIARNDTENIRRLVVDGVDIEARGLGGSTPLLIATHRNAIDAAQLPAPPFRPPRVPPAWK